MPENQIRVMYEELTPREFKKRLKQAPIAYLPLGTLEWHGEHLPLGADGLQSQGFFCELAREVGGVVLPMLFLGPDLKIRIEGKEYHGMDYYGFDWNLGMGRPEILTGSAYLMDKRLFRGLIETILGLLGRQGFRIVVGHGHGPSITEFKRLTPELEKKCGLKLFSARREDESDGFGIQTDHAAANETSLMMALRPELVHLENLSLDLEEKPKAVSGKDPRTHSSPEKGRQAISIQVERMSKILRGALEGGEQQIPQS